MAPEQEVSVCDELKGGWIVRGWEGVRSELGEAGLPCHVRLRAMGSLGVCDSAGFTTPLIWSAWVSAAPLQSLSLPPSTLKSEDHCHPWCLNSRNLPHDLLISGFCHMGISDNTEPTFISINRHPCSDSQPQGLAPQGCIILI